MLEESQPRDLLAVHVEAEQLFSLADVDPQNVPFDVPQNQRVLVVART